MTASPPNITTASSMKTESGWSGAAVTSRTGHPAAAKVSTYVDH